MEHLSSRMNIEYRMHIRGLFPSLAGYFTILLLALLVWDIAAIKIIVPKYKEYQCMQEYTYNSVMESSYETMEYPSLRKLDNIITFRSAEGKQMNINAYIQTGNSLAVCGNLQPGDIAVSQKMAEKMDIALGSEMEADYPVYDQPIVYKVAKILPYMSDFYNVQENVDFSVAIVGYDDVLYAQAQGKMVYFLDEIAGADFMEKEYSYSARYDVMAEMATFGNLLLILYGIVFAVIFGLSIVIAVLSHKEIARETVKYYYDGFDVRCVKMIDRRDHLLFWGIPVLSQICIMIVCVLDMGCPPIFAFAVLLSLVGTIGITLMIGGRKYGRAN